MRYLKASKRMRSAIGGIIMVAGELEHLIFCSVVCEADIDILSGFVLMQKMSISSKWNHLRYLIDAFGRFEKARSCDEINDAFFKFLRVRNTLAHGMFTHRDGKDHYYQVTTDFAPDVEKNLIGNRVSTFDAEEIERVTGYGETLCDFIRSTFKVRTLHEAGVELIRQDRPPTPKELRKKGAAARKNQPRSSPRTS